MEFLRVRRLVVTTVPSAKTTVSEITFLTSCANQFRLVGTLVAVGSILN